jgi:hypothetical protein
VSSPRHEPPTQSSHRLTSLPHVRHGQQLDARVGPHRRSCPEAALAAPATLLRPRVRATSMRTSDEGAALPGCTQCSHLPTLHVSARQARSVCTLGTLCSIPGLASLCSCAPVFTPPPPTHPPCSPHCHRCSSSAAPAAGR